jgi:hypothetical protein
MEGISSLLQENHDNHWTGYIANRVSPEHKQSITDLPNCLILQHRSPNVQLSKRRAVRWAEGVENRRGGPGYLQLSPLCTDGSGVYSVSCPVRSKLFPE